ncbi:hypothetical protein N7537_011120 [Penicillium hordei]|uniref:Uncharacterized protein n=1 Tax=Penicillium hordei TaxID=40994 RepID=A0AAD6DL91_9EURO|nr:uncharacterized protein N7537_011120 [Penicillium hordei]KAJ5588442.1 hypothetical protein N7537_011120 [Penicillium hordei]
MAPSKEEYQLTYVRLDDPPETATNGKRKSRPLSVPEQQAILQSQTNFFGSSWTFEILNCLVAVAFLVAIILVLYKFDGKPVPDWPYGITLNALVSVLSTAMKAAMMCIATESLSQLKWSWFNQGNKLSDLALLDAASRGPAGALIALFYFVPRHLITFGCLILVITAATDPFVQQVMGIQGRSVPTHLNASIQVCNSSLYTDFGEGAGPGMNKVPLPTIGAIYSGIFQEQTPNSKNPLVECATGNCTFAPYQSLGICSRCANITDLLTLQKAAGVTSQQATYKYKLPNDFTFQTSMTGTYLMNSTYLAPLVSLNTTGLASILNFTAITSSGYGVPPAVAVSATECSLHFCVDTYHAAVNGGAFTEKLTSIEGTSNYSSASFENFEIVPNTCYVNGTQQESTHSPECAFKVNPLSTLALSNSITPLLKGTGSLFISNRPSWSSDSIKALYGTYGNYTDINLVFQSLAASLTSHARSKICHASHGGTAWSTVSYVHVRWLWMILPITLVFLSSLFLIITIFHTRRDYIWKSSPLALLFSNLDLEGRNPFRTDPTLKGIQQTSRQMEVRLENSPDGPRIRAVPVS